MKINMLKQAGGVLIPASDLEVEKLNKFKTGEQYEIEIKLSRNPQFHRKVFTFFNFCFEHWGNTTETQYLDDQAQFDVFRNHMTVLAGFYNKSFNIKGDVRVEAKSLSFGSMAQEEFGQVYNALINVACQHIFKTHDQETLNKLRSFF